MKEEFLHFVFKNKLWENDNLRTCDNEKIEIIDTGIPNHDSGPDFFNAKVKINDTIWVGNIEIHIKASDWYKHKHDKDPAYNNVILHIVYSNDKQVYRHDKQVIPTWEIEFPHYIYNKYAELKSSDKNIACEDFIKDINEINRNAYIDRMGIEKIESKTETILNYLEKTKNNQEEAFYIMLLRNFGFHVNSMPFEQLALSTPLSILRKNSHNLTTIEAILFGQAGLLDVNVEDAYINSLKLEYKHAVNKYQLKPINREIWKFGRIRPGNFPSIRIAQVASLMQNFQGLFSNIINQNDISEIRKYFNIKTSEYWNKHYDFGKISDKISTGFGDEAFNTIMINTIAPFRIIISKHTSTSFDEIPIKWLETIKAENNRITKAWKSIGIIPENAYESQALIHLKNQYCDKKKCINCNIGIGIFKKLHNFSINNQ